MPKPMPNEELVWKELKDIFQGKDAEVRETKPIRKRIKANKETVGIRDILSKYGLENVSNVAKDLLHKGVFDSLVETSDHFMNVSEVMNDESAGQPVSNSKSAQDESVKVQGSEAVAVKIDETMQKAASVKGPDGPVVVAPKPTPAKSKSPKKPSRNATVPVPPPNTSSLPFKSQHVLLTRVQALLEAACYAFAQKALPEELKQNNWDSAECVELNAWTDLLAIKANRLSLDARDETPGPLDKLLGSMGQIHHTAVHRVRVSPDTLEKFLDDACTFAALLNDGHDEGEYVVALSTFRSKTKEILEELKHNKNVLDARLAAQREDFTKRRAELDRLERKAVDEIAGADKEYQAQAGMVLERVVATQSASSGSCVSCESDLEAEFLEA